MPEKIRTFIAIELSEEIHKELGTLIEQLRPIPGKINWVEPENVHLTLKFLGDITPEQIEQIKTVMNKAKPDFAPFVLSLAALGAFPKLNYPRVIWVGIKKGSAESIKLANIFEEALAKIGFPKEKRAFHPHLTLGRIKLIEDRQAYRKIMEKIPQVPSVETQVEEITLFQSRLTPKGSIYTAIHKI